MKSTSRFSLLIALASLLWAFGCGTNAQHYDPLAGWRHEDHNPDQAIDQDYQDYIRHLPPSEGKYAGPVHFLTDGDGRHAIVIMIGIDNKVWRHVLIYDRNDIRIKTIKYVSGDYHS